MQTHDQVEPRAELLYLERFCYYILCCYYHFDHLLGKQRLSTKINKHPEFFLRPLLFFYLVEAEENEVGEELASTELSAFLWFSNKNAISTVFMGYIAQKKLYKINVILQLRGGKY